MGRSYGADDQKAPAKLAIGISDIKPEFLQIAGFLWLKLPQKRATLTEICIEALPVAYLAW